MKVDLYGGLRVIKNEMETQGTETQDLDSFGSLV